MSFKLDKKLFMLLLISLIVIIAAAGVLVGLKISGFLDTSPVTPDPDDWYLEDDGEDGPWGEKTYVWTYGDIDRTISCYISKPAYQEFQYGIPGATLPEDLIAYAVSSGYGNVITSIAAELASIASSEEMTEQQQLDLIFSFVESITYQTDKESGRFVDYPRSPVVTLAEETGDSVDHSILASALLTELGYGTAILYYPPTYDRLTVIPEAAALGLSIASQDSNRLVYSAATTAPVPSLTFVPGQISRYPVSVTGHASPPEGAAVNGWYAGDGTWKVGKFTGTLGKAVYTPLTGQFTAEYLPQIPKISTEPVIYLIENATWMLPVSRFWVVDTSSKGTSPAAYDGITPVISADDSLWQGKSLNLNLPYTAQMEETLLVRSATGVPLTLKDWQVNRSAYYENTWYPSGTTWTTNDKWRLYQKFLDVGDVPATLYTPWGTTEHTAPVPWRISYRIQNMDDDRSDKGMTPYSDLRIAIYAIDDSGALTLLKTTGWQGHYGADKYQTIGPFSPGKYAIGVFVRNTKADLSIEYSGKADMAGYTGGI